MSKEMHLAQSPSGGLLRAVSASEKWNPGWMNCQALNFREICLKADTRSF